MYSVFPAKLGWKEGLKRLCKIKCPQHQSFHEVWLDLKVYSLEKKNNCDTTFFACAFSEISIFPLDSPHLLIIYSIPELEPYKIPCMTSPCTQR